MKRVLRLGTVPEITGAGRRVAADVFVAVSFEDGRLSLRGVVGPTPDGDCCGGCGQITLEPAAFTTFAPGWSAEEVARLAEVWSRWHLNDMRAGCEHQRAAWDPSERLEIVTYRLTGDALTEQADIKREVKRRLQAGESVTLDESERWILSLPFTIPGAPDADGIQSGRYEVHRRETKLAGWVYPNEHARGLLGKACEVCGYKYGSAWLREEVPAEVIAYLAGLPDADKPCPWSSF